MREPIHKFDKFTDLKDMLKISGENLMIDQHIC